MHELSKVSCMTLLTLRQNRTSHACRICFARFANISKEIIRLSKPRRPQRWSELWCQNRITPKVRGDNVGALKVRLSSGIGTELTVVANRMKIGGSLYHTLAGDDNWALMYAAVQDKENSHTASSNSPAKVGAQRNEGHSS